MDKRIGAQLYTLRDFCKTEEDLANTLKKLKEIGYQTAQFSGVGPIPPENINALCRQYGIEPICTHRPFTEFIQNPDNCAAYHKALGCNIAGIGGMPQEFPRTAQGVREFIKAMAPISQALKSHGLRFAYHNHAFEFIKENGSFLMDILINESDFDFIVDVYWAAFAGINPAKLIRRLGQRAVVIHFKDLLVLPDSTITMCEVMEGNLDWDDIFAACEEAGSAYAMVEQDTCRRDPFESMKISYDNLTKKGFV